MKNEQEIVGKAVCPTKHENSKGAFTKKERGIDLRRHFYIFQECSKIQLSPAVKTSCKRNINDIRMRLKESMTIGCNI